MINVLRDFLGMSRKSISTLDEWGMKAFGV